LQERLNCSWLKEPCTQEWSTNIYNNLFCTKTLTTPDLNLVL
jgi:hypothetical protein